MILKNEALAKFKVFMGLDWHGHETALVHIVEAWECGCLSDDEMVMHLAGEYWHPVTREVL